MSYVFVNCNTEIAVCVSAAHTTYIYANKLPLYVLYIYTYIEPSKDYAV